MRPTRHETCLRVARDWAERSTCARRQVGCVLVDVHGHTLATGHNGVARGEVHCTEVPCPGVDCMTGTGLTTCLALHAEINALMLCPDIFKVHACYTTTSPCLMCLRALKNTSCQEIHFLERYESCYAEACEQWLFNRLSEPTGRLWCQHGSW